MAGIYLHIPFCKSRCYYCDFHSCTALGMKKEMIDTICVELEQRKLYAGDEIIETIYFGGGTPSLLLMDEVSELLHTIKKHYTLKDDMEITFEANPEDLNIDYLRQLYQLGINRLSIGIQSFDDDELKFLNRRHNAKQAIQSLEDAQKAGFSNISIDLIYAIPNSSSGKWQKSLEQAFKLNIQHLSAYLLTLEEKTSLAGIMRTNGIKEIDEEDCEQQFQLLQQHAEKNGFIHYEISNFGKEGYFSRHNSSYWKDIKYIGVGPSAHSYNINSRQWNVSDNKEYIKKVKKGEKHFTVEILGIVESYNDYILTGLRTMWGINAGYIGEKFGEKYKKLFLKEAEKNEKAGYMERKGQYFRITAKARFITDSIITGFIAV